MYSTESMNGVTITADVLPTSISALLREGPPPLKLEEIEAIYAIGATLYERERFAEASDLFRVVVLCRPTDARGWLALGACHEAADDNDRAIALYEVATTAPDSARERIRAGIYLARLLLRTGRREEAQERFAWTIERAEEGTLDDEMAFELRIVRAMLEDAS